MDHNMDRTILEIEEPAFSREDEGDYEGPLSSAEELGFASELLDVNTEEELDHFLGRVLNKSAGAVRRFASSQRGQAVAGHLKAALKDALPGIGRALADQLRPGSGDAGARLGADLGQVLGLEMEGLTAEDQEFEMSRQLVRLISSAAQHACHAARASGPDEAAREAVAAALHHYAPGLATHMNGHFAEADRALSPLSEEEEEELATELLEVSGEEDLDHFLGNVMRKAHKPAARRPAPHRPGTHKPGAQRPARRTAGVTAFLNSPAAQALGGILKQAAKSALPEVGAALGTAIAPGIGTTIGGALGTAASNMFEINQEEMSEEEAEFETARRFVGLSAAAAHHLAGDPHAGTSPRAAAWDAVLKASREYAPGLNRRVLGQPGNGHRRHHRRHEHRFGDGVEFPVVLDEPVVEVPGLDGIDGGEPRITGRWERHGHRIILHGV